MSPSGGSIRSVEVVLLRLRLRAPFAVTSGIRDHIDTVLLRVVTADGTVGWGEATPDESVTGETLAVSTAVLRGVLSDALVHVDVDDPSAAGRILDAAAPRCPAARAAADVAVHDAASRRAGLPLWAYLAERSGAGGSPDGSTSGEAAPGTASLHPAELRVSRVVSMQTPAQMAADAARHVASGFTTVKLKVGEPVDWRRDVERVAAVRAEVGPDVGIKVDANEGWVTTDVAGPAMVAMAASRPLFVEQPLRRDDVEGLAELRRQVPSVPVMADEAAASVADVQRLADLGAADLVNLKLMRLGGVREVVRADAVAAAAGIRTQIGTMIESSVASAAGLHVAKALDNVAHVEMGGPMMLAQDPGDLLRCYRGELVVLPDRPGLGITPTSTPGFS